MNRLRILVRLLMKAALLASIGLGLASCSPKMDWREVRLDAISAAALFPAKPVEVSRSLKESDASSAFTLTLRSARVDDTVFAVGWVLDGSSETRAQLESAMLANLNGQPESVKRQRLLINDLEINELQAVGSMRLSRESAAVPAVLWMRSLVLTEPQPGSAGKGPVKTIEIIAAGPQSQLHEEDARQFLESFRLIQ